LEHFSSVAKIKEIAKQLGFYTKSDSSNEFVIVSSPSSSEMNRTILDKPLIFYQEIIEELREDFILKRSCRWMY